MRIRSVIFPLFGALSVFLAACMPKTPPITVELPVEEPPAIEIPEPVSLPEPYDTRALRARSNMRTEPNTSAALVGTFDAGTVVGLLKLTNGWFYVRIDSALGWVYAPLVQMTPTDRFAAALSVLSERTAYPELFVAKFQAGNGELNLVLDFAWRNMTTAQKERAVEQTGNVWKAATEAMGFTTPPVIHFMSNNDVEMARWHGFWGVSVFH